LRQVLIDCNHPLAGAPLVFTLRLLAIDAGAGEEAAEAAAAAA
jgi:FKBP-type peptidyl-prolyl cis-trans isomerase 2